MKMSMNLSLPAARTATEPSAAVPLHRGRPDCPLTVDVLPPHACGARARLPLHWALAWALVTPVQWGIGLRFHNPEPKDLARLTNLLGKVRVEMNADTRPGLKLPKDLLDP